MLTSALSSQLFTGVTLHHLPGHTAGLCGLQLNLRDSGTWVFLSDHAHVKENYFDGVPQGWLGECSGCPAARPLKSLPDM